MNKDNQKQPFYIFFEVDGVLYDDSSAHNIHGPWLHIIEEPFLKTSSIIAFNNLTSFLEKQYDTKLILISRRRDSLQECIEYLKRYGISYDKPIFATEFKPGPRGKKILETMEKDGLNPNKKTSLKKFIANKLLSAQDTPSFKNYVVINPPSSKISRYIPKSHLIKTDPIRKSLTQSQVDEFFENLYAAQTYQKEQ